MYQKFTVDTVTIHESKNTIEVKFTHELDPDSISATSLYITNHNDNNIIPIKYTIDDDIVLLNYGNNIKHNVQYDIVATKEIKSAMDEELDIEFIKSFTITNTADSTVNILSAANHEQLETMTIKFEEVFGASKKNVNRYRHQIGDHDFLAPFIDTIIDNKTEITIGSVKPAKQYYARIRAEKSNTDFGIWSNKVTFTLSNGLNEKDNDNTTADNKNNDNKPIIENDFIIAGYPENGTTPESFLIEFDDEIDPASIDMSNILLTRKKV